MEVNIPLGKGKWIRDRADEPHVYVTNRFFEQNPTNTQDGVALIERPALVEILEAGVGPGRRLHHEPGFCNGDLFHVSGNELYAHHMNADRTITTRKIPGVISGGPKDFPDMAATDQYLWITDGTSLQYTDGTAALVSVPTPDDIPFVSLDVFNQFVLCVRKDSDRFYYIQPSATTIDGLDFARAERFPDKVFQVRVIGDEFWLLGERSIEVWRATGDGDAPFQRIEGRVFNFGIWPGTAVRLPDTSVNCIADDGRVYNIAGTPHSISNPAIAEIFRNAILAAKADV